jgi:hypothetical protein
MAVEVLYAESKFLPGIEDDSFGNTINAMNCFIICQLLECACHA